MRYPDLQIDLLRAFIAVAESGGFTAASALIGRTQSAVSQKVLRLEETLGCRLFDRNSRSLVLTPHGEQLLVLARRMLEFNDAAVRRLVNPPVVGNLRLGVAEDFIPLQLSGLLAKFRRLYPQVRLELMTGLSSTLLAAYDAGSLDIVIAKKDGAGPRGRVFWREPLVWMASRDWLRIESEPVSLVVLPPPCPYREIMTRTLDSMRFPWSTVCTASSLMGAQAAVAGGMGITVLGRSFVRPDLQILSVAEGWPVLPMTEIIIIGEESASAELAQPLLEFLSESLAGAVERSG